MRAEREPDAVRYTISSRDGLHERARSRCNGENTSLEPEKTEPRCDERVSIAVVLAAAVHSKGFAAKKLFEKTAAGAVLPLYMTNVAFTVAT